MNAELALRYDGEARHFDALVDLTGESWWGHQTSAGRLRLKRRAQLICEALPLGPACHMIEIAAGAGALTEALLQQIPDARITATDISLVSVRRLHERVGRYPNVECIQADITRLEGTSSMFDAVIGNSALHHVDVPTCLAQLYRVLKPGGRLMVFEPNLANPEVYIETMFARRFATRKLNYSVDERTFTRSTYAKMLRTTGFTDVMVRPFDFLHPITPSPLLPAIAAFGRFLECTPILREFSGSLLLSATKP